MPFTVTHIAAILPLTALRVSALPASALAIGAMVPDWGLFVSVGPHYDTTHTFTGIVTACVPLGLLLFLIYHELLKRPLLELAAPGLRARLRPLVVRGPRFGLAGLAGAALAIALGALTHLCWDAFTHEARWGVALVPALDRAVMTVGGVAVPGYTLFQHGSSALFLPLMLWLAWRWLRRAQPQPGLPPRLGQRARQVCLLLLAGAPLLVMLWTALRYFRLPLDPNIVGAMAYFGVIAGGQALLVALLVYGTVFWFYAGLHARR